MYILSYHMISSVLVCERTDVPNLGQNFKMQYAISYAVDRKSNFTLQMTWKMLADKNLLNFGREIFQG